MPKLGNIGIEEKYRSEHIVYERITGSGRGIIRFVPVKTL